MRPVKRSKSQFVHVQKFVVIMFGFKIIIVTIIVSVDAVTADKNKLYLENVDLEQIGKRFYKKELLTDDYSDPKELAYDPVTRNLFFMYMDDEIQNSGRAVINVVTRKSRKIKGIKNNKATAVDTDTGDVYFGSNNGLYKYDAVNNEAINIGLYNIDVLKIVVRNKKIYMIDANDHMLYKFEDNLAVGVGDWKGLVEFEIDNSNYIHMTTLCGVFCDDGNDTIKNNDISIAYHFIVDDDKTYGIKENAIYDINCKKGTAVKISDLNFFPKSIVYGHHGIIYYVNQDIIYKLTPVRSYLVYNVFKRGGK